jgi:hypothetical protein
MLLTQSRPLLQVDTVRSKASTPVASYIPFPGDARERYDHFHTSVFRCVAQDGRCNGREAHFLCRSYQMEIQVQSPSVKVGRVRGHEAVKSLPVFSDQDRVEGLVRLDPHLYVSPGQLVITVSSDEAHHTRILI